jgi:hypothetical protein
MLQLRACQVYSFDLMLFPYSPTVVHLIDSTFPGRFRVSRGDSTVSVPQHVHRVVAGKSPWCDVALVDGDHSFAGSKQDLINIAQMAKCNATLLADDINEGPGQALKEVCQSCTGCVQGARIRFLSHYAGRLPPSAPSPLRTHTGGGDGPDRPDGVEHVRQGRA